MTTLFTITIASAGSATTGPVVLHSHALAEGNRHERRKAAALARLVRCGVARDVRVRS